MEYYNLFLRQEYAEIIRKSKNWHKRGWPAKLATAIRITRPRAYEIVKGEKGCSSNVACRIATFMGIPEGDCWCFMFDRKVGTGLNMAKFEGEVPYQAYSSTAEFRRLDGLVESEEMFQNSY